MNDNCKRKPSTLSPVKPYHIVYNYVVDGSIVKIKSFIASKKKNTKCTEKSHTN